MDSGRSCWIQQGWVDRLTLSGGVVLEFEDQALFSLDDVGCEKESDAESASEEVGEGCWPVRFPSSFTRLASLAIPCADRK